MPGRGVEPRPGPRPARPGIRPGRHPAAATNDNEPSLGRRLAGIPRWAALVLIAIAAVWIAGIF